MTYAMDSSQNLCFSQLLNLPGPNNFSHHDVSLHLTVATCFAMQWPDGPSELGLGSQL